MGSRECRTCKTANRFALGAFLLFSSGAISSQSNLDYATAITEYHKKIESLVADCQVLKQLQGQRDKLDRISAETSVNTGGAELCITTPDLNITGLRSIASVIVGYGTGSIPAIGPIVDELANLLIIQGFDHQNRKCYPVKDGQEIYRNITSKLGDLEKPYQELRGVVRDRWWATVNYEDTVTDLAHDGPSEKIPERIARVTGLSARKNQECPQF